MQTHGLFSPWNSSGQNTGVGNLSLLQGIFPTQGLNPGIELPYCRRILLPAEPQGKPKNIGVGQFSSVAQSCPTLCDPMNSSMPGLPVHHHLLESTETHIHRVSDAIQPSHPLLSPFPPAPNPSQYQNFFQRVNSLQGGQSIGVSALASFLPKNTQD